MDTLTKYNITKKEYIKIDELLQLKMVTLEDCKNSRRFIDIKKVPKNEFIYAKYLKGRWITTCGKSFKYDKVFVTVDWINANITDGEEESNEESDHETEELNEESEEEIEEEPEEEPEPESEEEIEEEPEEEPEEESEEEIDVKSKILLEPGLIELKKSEKIKDTDGNILEIEVRGTRKQDNCYFLVKDVAKGFGMAKLRDILTNKKSSYEYGRHINYFLKNHDDKKENSLSKDPINYGKVKKVQKLYLTYIGLLKVLFSSRNNQVDKFVQWATKTLFTAHLGTSEQKSKLTAKLMGVSLEAVKEVFNKTSSGLPVIYLITMGKVKDLRVALKIGKEYDDEDMVCDGGQTTNLAQRMEQHEATLGKMPGVKLYLKWYNYIDPQYLYKGETELFQTMDKMGFKFVHPKYKEILIFSKKDIKVVLDQYANISNKYIGHVKEISEKLKDMEYQIRDMESQHKLDMMTKDKEIVSLRKDNELLKKDLEMEKMKNELNMLKKDAVIELLKKKSKK
jgi:prophage antirepressor-like protein